MPSKTIEVNMSEVRFTSDENTALTTHGLTTCIAFLVQGSFWDDDEDEEIEYCGLYHWTGFDLSSTPHDQQAVNILTHFFEKLRAFAGLGATSDITIETLAFIGGEKEQRDATNKILVSGTEAEVNSLKKAVTAFNFAALHLSLSPEDISYQHFLTSGEQSISIELDISEYTVQFEETTPETQDDIKEQDDMEYSSTTMLSA
ncbi:hypothetical protein [Legionella fallonii]|uniref:Uncharacterized protein n=1 Tax=Legionella fallonii LLAP-10 TaxID=1212491 RepID=A0A098G9S7_9GAMM|nr:hypothetical protein [Legionella fallonii]CEG58755.1 protein of unknown function [Legionella fallonii LLAP-10]